MVDYLKRLFARLDAKYETFRDDFEAEYFLQKNALAMIRLRRASGLTQTEFARNAGMTQGNLSRLEKGNYNPTLAHLQKISKGRFNNLEDWKKAYFDEVVQQAKKGLHSFELNGKTINSYEELQTLFEEAVQKDLRSLKNGTVNPQNVVELKAKVFKQLLKATNSFKEEVFKK